jgi:hypothetical protein
LDRERNQDRVAGGSGGYRTRGDAAPGSAAKGWVGTEGRGADAAARKQAAQLVKRRAQAVELYSGVVALAIQPRKADTSDSSMVRHLAARRACWSWQCFLHVDCPPVADCLGIWMHACCCKLSDFINACADCAVVPP